MIQLESLEDRVGYNVIRNEHNCESIILSGRAIKRQPIDNPDFKYFKPDEAMFLHPYVRVCMPNGLHIGVWLDPTRPELRDGEIEPLFPPMSVDIVNAVVSIPQTARVLDGCINLIWTLR